MCEIIWKMVKDKDIAHLPAEKGIFVISVQDINSYNDFVALYIGRAQNIKKKVCELFKKKNSYLKLRGHLNNRTAKISYMTLSDESQSKKIESYLNEYYCPPFSRRHKLLNDDSIIVNRPNVKKWKDRKY